MNTELIQNSLIEMVNYQVDFLSLRLVIGISYHFPYK
jgi:hypothetical protein